MRLSCPSCGATYELPETLLAAAGQHVQCTACHTRWFARRPEPAAPRPGPRLVVDAERPGVPDPTEPAGAPADMERAVTPDDMERAVAPDGTERAVAPDGTERAVAPDDTERAVAPDDAERAVVPDDAERPGGPERPVAPGDAAPGPENAGGASTGEVFAEDPAGRDEPASADGVPAGSAPPEGAGSSSEAPPESPAREPERGAHPLATTATDEAAGPADTAAASDAPAGAARSPDDGAPEIVPGVDATHGVVPGEGDAPGVMPGREGDAPVVVPGARAASGPAAVALRGNPANRSAPGGHRPAEGPPATFGPPEEEEDRRLPVGGHRPRLSLDTAAGPEPPPPPPRRRRFGRGVVTGLGLVALAVALYHFAGEIASAAPPTEPVLAAYAGAVDDARAWLEARIAPLLGQEPASPPEVSAPPDVVHEPSAGDAEDEPPAGDAEDEPPAGDGAD